MIVANPAGVPKHGRHAERVDREHEHHDRRRQQRRSQERERHRPQHVPWTGAARPGGPLRIGLDAARQRSRDDQPHEGRRRDGQDEHDAQRPVQPRDLEPQPSVEQPPRPECPCPAVGVHERRHEQRREDPEAQPLRPGHAKPFGDERRRRAQHDRQDGDGRGRPRAGDDGREDGWAQHRRDERRDPRLERHARQPRDRQRDEDRHQRRGRQPCEDDPVRPAARADRAAGDRRRCDDAAR